MDGTLRPEDVSTKLSRIAQLATEDPKRALTTLAHHIDIEFLRVAFERTRKDGATGVDGQTAEDYEKNLESNLRSARRGHAASDGDTAKSRMDPP